MSSSEVDLSTGRFLAVVETEFEAVHVGRIRFSDKWLVTHEGGDTCCNGLRSATTTNRWRPPPRHDQP